MDDFFNPRAWMKYINPVEWFRGGMSTVEGVIMTVVVVITLVLGLVLNKFFSCCACFINVFRKLARLCCCGRKEKEVETQELADAIELQMAERGEKAFTKGVK